MKFAINKNLLEKVIKHKLRKQKDPITTQQNY